MIFCRIYGIVEILSIALHAFVYIRIYFYKKQELEENTLNMINQIDQSNQSHMPVMGVLQLSSIDAESLSSFGINLLIILCLGSTTIVARHTGQIEPQQLNVSPYYYMIYYNNFIVVSIMTVLILVLIYKRNLPLKKALRDQTLSVWSNLTE